MICTVSPALEKHIVQHLDFNEKRKTCVCPLSLKEKQTCLQELVYLQLTTECVVRGTPCCFLHASQQPFYVLRNPFFLPNANQLFCFFVHCCSNRCPISFLTRAPRPLFFLSLYASTSQKQSLLSSSLLRRSCIIPYKDTEWKIKEYINLRNQAWRCSWSDGLA